MSNNLTDILVNLDVIAQVAKMEKLNTFYSKFEREKPSWITPIKRYWRGDYSEKTVNAIDKLVDAAVKSIEKQSYDERTLFKIYKFLMRAVAGLKNLRYTYDDIDSTRSHLSIIIDRLEELPTLFTVFNKRYKDELELEHALVMKNTPLESIEEVEEIEE